MYVTFSSWLGWGGGVWRVWIEGLIKSKKHFLMYASIIELARCHCFLEFCHQHYVYHTSASFFFFFMGGEVGCICTCTNVIYISNAPKLSCGCQQPNTFWCVCVWLGTARPVCNVHKCCFVLQLHLNQSMVDMRARTFSSPKLPSWTAVLCESRQTFGWEAFEEAGLWTCETSQCYSFSCADDAPTCWGDHSGALYW